MGWLTGIGEKFIEYVFGLYYALYRSLIKPFDIFSMEDLVFGNGGEDWIFNTFRPTDITDVTMPGYYLFLTLSGGLIIALIAINGMRISSAAINPVTRNVLLTFVMDLILVVLLILNLPTLFQLILSLNEGIVNFFHSAYSGEMPGFETNEPDTVEKEGIIGFITIQLILFGLAIWGNFYYMMRKLTLIILMILAPLMAVFWLTPRTKYITVSWLKEFIGTIFIQSIHAMLFFTIYTISSADTGYLASVILYVIFIPLGESIRSLFGLGGGMHNNLAKAGSMFGLSSMAALGGSIKGAMGDKSVMGTLRGAYDGIRNRGKGGEGSDKEGTGSTLGGNTGTDTGTTSRAEKMLKAGEISSKAGKAVFGAAGAIAGSGLGPAGAIALSTAGFNAGGAAAGLTGRAFTAVGQKIADNFGKGIDRAKDTLNKDNIDSMADDIAGQKLENWEKANKESFMNDLKERFPDATPEQLGNLYETEKARVKDAFKKEATGAINKSLEEGGTVKASDLVKASADSYAAEWANDNKASFVEDYKSKNPSATEEEINKAFAKAVSNKHQEGKVLATQAAESLLGGKDLDKSLLSKEDFSNKLADTMVEHDKEAFKRKLVSSGSNLSDEEIDSKFEEEVGSTNLKGKYLDRASQAVEKVNSSAGKNGYVNRDVLASNLAGEMTNQQQQSFIRDQMAKGMDKEQAEQAWQTQEATAFNNNYDTAMKQVEQATPNNQMSTVTNSVKGVRALKAAAAFVGGATGVTQMGESLQNLSANIAASGLKEGVQNHLIQSYGDGDVTEAQRNITKGLSFVGGTILGVSGYQKAASLATKLNPLNNLVNQATKEVSEMAQEVQTVQLEDGSVEIKRGAIRQVVTANDSYIEMTDKTGQTSVVSRLGSGDSSLRNGEKIYQDLTIEGNALVAQSIPGSNQSTYTLDSGGSRVLSNRVISADPNQLIATNPLEKPAVEYIPYSQQVDAGQFHLNDVKTHSQGPIKHIVERTRSYLVAQTADGREYRISPYGEGNTQLAPNQSQVSECHIVNQRIQSNGSVVMDNNTGAEVKIDVSNLDPNDLIPIKPNSRFSKRQKLDQNRHFSF